MKIKHYLLSLFYLLLSSYSLYGQEPIVTDIHPHVGLVAEEKAVQVTGNGFHTEQGLSLFFGSLPAPFTRESNHTLNAIARRQPFLVPMNVEVVVASSEFNSLSTPNPPFTTYTYHGDWIAFAIKSAYQFNQNNVDAQDLTAPFALSPNLSVDLFSFTGDIAAITPNSQLMLMIDYRFPGLLLTNLNSNFRTSYPLFELEVVQVKGIAITPDGTTAYIPDYRAGTIIPFHITYHNNGSLHQETAIPTHSKPTNIAITPNGLFAYVVDQEAGIVTPIDLQTKQAGNPIKVGDQPIAITILPNGQAAYVANAGSKDVSVIDLNTHTVIASIHIELEMTPTAIAAAPNGQLVYAAYSNQTSSSLVARINAATNQLEGTTLIPFTTGNLQLAFTPDSQFAYVVGSESSNSQLSNIVQINTANNQATIISSDIPVPLASIVITPDQSPIARFTSSPVPLSLTQNFDATQSTTATGEIVSYAWDFGDGTTTVTSIPTISHTYKREDVYLVILTVTNSSGTSTQQTFTGQAMSQNGEFQLATFVQKVNVSLNPDASPIISSLNPRSGPSTGGTQVLIRGDFFENTTAVHFGRKPAEHFTVIDDNTIIAISPPNSGTVNVIVNTPAGNSGNRLSILDMFTYITIRPPLAPTHFRATLKTKRFEAIAKLKWRPSLDPSVVKYQLFRNGKLIATIPASGPFSFKDRLRSPKRKWRYKLVAVNAEGQTSKPVKIVLD